MFAKILKVSSIVFLLATAVLSCIALINYIKFSNISYSVDAFPTEELQLLIEEKNEYRNLCVGLLPYLAGVGLLTAIVNIVSLIYNKNGEIYKVK